MNFGKEYHGKFGTFYSPWAYEDNEREKMKRNKEMYDKLMDVLKIHGYGGKFFGNGDELFKYSCSNISYGRNSYIVKQKPDWMTMAEAALVVDGGNLCFGFHVSGNTIDIYTD